MSATHRIHMLLDRSGSMSGYRQQCIAAVNGYLAALRKDALASDTSFSLTTFDSESIDAVRRDEPGARVRDLREQEFEPRAATPLHDAIGHVIDVERRIAVKGRRAIVIVTDGAENGSRRLNENTVRQQVAEYERSGWIFIFLGANQDAGAEAARIGVPKERAISYRASSAPSALATFAAAAAVSFTYFLLKPDAAATSEAAPGFSENDRKAAYDGASDWAVEMARDMGTAPSEPPAGDEPATINDDVAGEFGLTSEASDLGGQDVDTSVAADVEDAGDSIVDAISGAIGSVFSIFTEGND